VLHGRLLRIVELPNERLLRICLHSCSLGEC
jgi:hypothetical protein